MLLRQKAIVEGGLVAARATSRYGGPRGARPGRSGAQRAQLLLDLLTPMAKTFPAEKGFETNALAVQIHGGYGYSSEYLPEAWLRTRSSTASTRAPRASRGWTCSGARWWRRAARRCGRSPRRWRATVARARRAGVDARVGEELRRGERRSWS